MKRTYFIKHDQRIRIIVGCDRATLILDRLEFYSSRQPDGFYKFLEPNSHKLYKKDDSWTELLNCHRTSFWRAFKLIGKKYASRWEFEKAEDKFEGKLYASYYDRHTNRMFFIRNHDAVKEFFANIQPGSEFEYKAKKSKEESQSRPDCGKIKNSLRTEQNARSYKESKPTSLDLSKDKSHAEEIIKKMIEIWTALVEEGRGLVKLSKTTVPFLKKAFADKFDNCLEKWKKYCYDIASSRFLMGEKTSFKAWLDWALVFKNIEKVMDGQYGIGDRTPKAILPSQDELREDILSSEEPLEIKNFRTLCLKKVGNANYISNFKQLSIEFRDGGELALVAPHKFGADFLEQNCYSYLRLILEELEGHITRISILAPGETRGRLIERKKEGRTPTESLVEYPNDKEFPMEKTIPTEERLTEVSAKNVLKGSQNLPQYESLEQDADFLANLTGYGEEGIAFKDMPLLDASLETKELRAQLRKNIPSRQFPSWLDGIEVEDVRRDGAVVVALEDAFAVEWCRSRFKKEVFEATASLWRGVDKLIIRQKEGNKTLLPIEILPKRLENVAEKTILEQAIQSLRSVSSTGPMREFEMRRAFGVSG